MKARATNHMATTAALVTVVAIIGLLGLGAPTTEAYRYSVSFGASQAWSLPAGAANVSVTLWGGGGGSSTSLYCGAGGGSGATIVGRAVDSSDWSISASDPVWSVVIGKGGAPSPVGAQESVAGDGGATSIVAMMPDGTVLFNATAYGGGGGKASSRVDRTGCQGGAGGGASSSAVGPQPGGGDPSGGADNDRQAAPKEGALVGDIKAGSAGAGFGYAFDSPITRGAPWRGFGRTWSGGAGRGSTLCWSSGGAAAYGGNGGAGSNSASGSTPLSRHPDANSGAGAGSAEACKTYVLSQDAAGADGGAVIEYDHPVAPSPSASPAASVTPSRTPSPSRTPLPSPTPTAQPLTQLITLVSPISGRQLTPQEDGSVKSLWVGASYKEKWTVARLPNGKYTLRGFNGKYLGANPGGWVRAEVTSVGAWEQWDVLINAGNQWTLKSTHGTYLGTTAAGVVYLNDNADLYWTKTNV
ncbi:Fascin-like incomplete domain containing protein [Pandoravirus quercus]|uniref:Fascin-like incomplete domain containing protein n=1 Tax=Pandoravirus quercus TaxID=2107709 RepID=A0A2U7UA31_9VIRU|nr:Fascin-like incomplete domain containing protein [Pandoravirus quercus]AVK75289.1 Fascin-like incomplete domain containing protein [Pandoravirus quercus]